MKKMMKCHPIISIVIPSKGRAEPVSRLIGSINQQDYPQDRMEIIVIDDGSEIPYRFDDERIKLIRHDRSVGAQKGRNMGIRHATGDLIFMCDDDVELMEPGYLSACHDLLDRRPEVGAVFSRKIDCISKNGCITELDYSTSRVSFYSGDLEPACNHTGPIQWGHQAYLIRKSILLELGGYDGIYGLNGGHSFREESDLQSRLRQAGYQLWLLDHITMRHHIQADGGHGASIGRRLYWIAHNHMVFLRRHIAFWPLRAVGFLLDVLRYSWVQGRMRYTGRMMQGYLAGWRNALRDRGPGRNAWLEQA